ncbi:tRNA N6-adenosine(37)-N6-threonylcarbamoyltransferase complex dimerization subunit TsaB [Oscillatoriales cyanobacterium USR001]|nr:tRNA N6-adenosine(37)-N6-threonylcarbamoyltransferase complex dimerization subunit TsaB [Oscillatoriales cyanobacterium USR001]
MTNNKSVQYGLAIHTSSPELGLAISNFAGDNRCQIWNLGRDLATHLHQHILDFIQPQTWADLGFIAVAKGPGSFTGTRIGVVTARTLAQQLDIPLFAISTLATMAWEERKKEEGRRKKEEGRRKKEEVEKILLYPDISIAEKAIPAAGYAYALQMPAQRGQIFGAIYAVKKINLEPNNLGLIELLPDTVMTTESWQNILESWQKPYHLIEVPNDLGASVSSLLELAYLEYQQGKRPNWSEALPYYGQHPVKEKE